MQREFIREVIPKASPVLSGGRFTLQRDRVPIRGMDAYAIRLANLRNLVAKDTTTGVANKVGLAPSYVSQMAGPNPVKHIGPKLARRIESAYRLPNGWMDQLHGPDQGSGTVDEEKRRFLAAASSLYDASPAKGRRAMMKFLNDLLK